MKPSSLPFWNVRVVHLLQWCGIFRFSDHRGLKPTDIALSRNSPVAKLTRSKATGEDREAGFRLLVVNPCCVYQQSEKLSTGWKSLNFHADFSGDYLMPLPSSNYASAQGSDKYARVAKHRMDGFAESCVRAYHATVLCDPLGQEEHLQEFEPFFLEKKGLPACK